MSSNPTTPYDEERASLGMLVESVEELESEPPDPGSDTALLEQLLELLSVDSSADNDDADINSSFARTSMSDEEIFEWQHNISAEPGTSFAALHMHTARAPVHLQAERSTERTHQSHAVSRPNCWIALSVGWPWTDVSFRHFGMVHWSHAPHISINSQYMYPQTNLYPRAPLGSLNGVPQCDSNTAEPGRAGTLFYPDSLLSLPSL